ncbi:hypothetical protein FOXG_18202 [Fusarium oxysporum f. sp. lycopersici 4287]|uniref:Uncharacterized protein n=2 Tax=Fusarium oxysporum TaxID=5507 RepID=A0A0J9UFK6_FUSO4|nr:hypothetical protein FOXG_18202 [Fusarium oxysporum f. sp. lycopersici 4287]EXK42123.1 hypothetical protein FOMG_05207 [Fusarium oxysporum f. sp. melonis 26406]KNA96890.1 hypothetical protein FOXG_18202 [Fusarium oxysporum f. sp. lycopersici 4287]
MSQDRLGWWTVERVKLVIKEQIVNQDRQGRQLARCRYVEAVKRKQSLENEERQKSKSKSESESESMSATKGGDGG